MCISVHVALRRSPFRWLILIDINTPVRLSLIICFIIMLHSASSLNGPTYIQLGCLRDPASPILLFSFLRISLRSPHGGLREVRALKMSKEVSFLSSSVTLFSEIHLFLSVSVLVSLPTSPPAGGFTVNATWRRKEGYCLCLGRASVCFLRILRNYRVTVETDMKRQIFRSPQQRVWQRLVFQARRQEELEAPCVLGASLLW